MSGRMRREGRPWQGVASAWRRLRHGRRLTPVRRALAPAALVASMVARHRGSATTARRLRLLALGLMLRAYVAERRRGRSATSEHVARLRRLDRRVLRDFYVRFRSSMEAELELYPAYDRRKHERRYHLVAEAAAAHAPRGGVVVDVGCASALVLDSVAAARSTRGVGIDLARFGLRQRRLRPDPPLLAQGVVEQLPLPDAIADVVVFSEVIEHLVDAWAGISEVSRITRPGGVVILTTNNASEMPVTSPLHDPLTWLERVVGRDHPRVLGFRNLTWHDPVDREVDRLPEASPTYLPHVHFAAAELRELAEDAGFEVISEASFEFPAPQSPAAERLRRLTARRPGLGNRLADWLDAAAASLPGVRTMGTHHLIVLRRVGASRAQPRRPWWVAELIPSTAAGG